MLLSLSIFLGSCSNPDNRASCSWTCPLFQHWVASFPEIEYSEFEMITLICSCIHVIFIIPFRHKTIKATATTTATTTSEIE